MTFELKVRCNFHLCTYLCLALNLAKATCTLGNVDIYEPCHLWFCLYMLRLQAHYYGRHIDGTSGFSDQEKPLRHEKPKPQVTIVKECHTLKLLYADYFFL